MSLHSLIRTGKRGKQRVGRGQSSGRGKTSGRGTKGQNARAGRKKRPELRDIIKKIPKRRGYGKNRGRTVFTMRPRATAVSLQQLELNFTAGATVNAEALAKCGLIKTNGKKSPDVKIIGTHGLTKKLSVEGVTVTKGARAVIEKAGGSVK